MNPCFQRINAKYKTMKYYPISTTIFILKMKLFVVNSFVRKIKFWLKQQRWENLLLSKGMNDEMKKMPRSIFAPFFIIIKIWDSFLYILVLALIFGNTMGKVDINMKYATMINIGRQKQHIHRENHKFVH